MAASSLFISYGHGDMTPNNWLERLKLYLAPLRRKEVVKIWDDTCIAPGSEWQKEIAQALDRASSSILLVGPAFLASEFIAFEELPNILGAAKTRGASIYPLVVAYCGYKRSVLGPYQAFNNPDSPLEALAAHEQNKILNDISIRVDDDLRQSTVSVRTIGKASDNTRESMARIAEELKKTATAFVAQCQRRNLLMQSIKKRVKVKEQLEYEKFFFRYYGQLDDEEKFQFDQIRAMTEGPLHDGNEAILGVIENDPRVLEEVPSLIELRQHIVFWLNKYEKVFVKRPEMCLLYTGVEDGVPFPKRVDKDIDEWMSAKK